MYGVLIPFGGVGTSGSERCHLHEDQAQNALDKPVVEKTTTYIDPGHHDPQYLHDILQPHVLTLMQRLPGALFQQENARPHTVRVSGFSPHCYYPFLDCPIPRLVCNRAYLGSFGKASWASHEFE
ncbi:uncharacterized protein TNCV_3341431 [Trichonephila clavipes]|nr:uncharacterized protein TNCV_3341431 [Trichonephila clavipes]